MKQRLLPKIILVAVSILFVLDIINAQTYHPMPTSSAKWDVARCWAFYPGGWHDEYSIRMDGSDTIMNGHTYKKLMLVTHHLPGTQFDSVYTDFLGGMREFNKQVFFVSEYLCIDTIERMVYDFNDTSTGDTIYTQILTNGLTQFIPHIVISVDFVEVNGESHRRINLQDESGSFSESWIEGIGSSLGLTYASYWQLTDNSYDLHCFYANGALQYTNPNPQYLFCTAPVPEVQCDSVNTRIPEIDYSNRFRIYPNPSADYIRIESDNEFQSVQIINNLGKACLVDEYSDEIRIESLPPGIYFIQIIDTQNKVFETGKFVKI